MLDQQATGRIGKVGWESSCYRVACIFPGADFWCLAVDSIVACAVVLWNLQALRLYWFFTIHSFHSFFAPKIPDAFILHASKVLKRFNRHLNHKCELTMITRKTLRDHFWCSIWSLILSSPLFTLDTMYRHTCTCIHTNHTIIHNYTCFSGKNSV